MDFLRIPATPYNILRVINKGIRENMGIKSSLKNVKYRVKIGWTWETIDGTVKYLRYRPTWPRVVQ